MLGRLDLFCYDTCAKKKKKNLPVLDARRPWLAKEQRKRMKDIKPALFGLSNSNRDFGNVDSWGKNQFNSSFPASLCCYLASKNLKANYFVHLNKAFQCKEISIEDAFGIPVTSNDIYFAFEAAHMPFQKYIKGSLPRTDLVIQKKSTGECLRGLEVKLTALPDNTTCALPDDDYGSEIVIRPDTIVYLACSIASSLGTKINSLIDKKIQISDWSDPSEVLQHIENIVLNLKRIASKVDNQKPFLLQPVWKTLGKSPQLAENCLDVFIWSDLSFMFFISEVASTNKDALKITRQTRTAIWLFKMLLDVAKQGSFDQSNIIDNLSYNTKNDKAFASAGSVTNKFMRGPNLTLPRIQKSEIKKIILGGGQELLSPERRFDAIIYNSPELFL